MRTSSRAAGNCIRYLNRIAAQTLTAVVTAVRVVIETPSTGDPMDPLRNVAQWVKFDYAYDTTGARLRLGVVFIRDFPYHRS